MEKIIYIFTEEWIYWITVYNNFKGNKYLILKSDERSVLVKFKRKTKKIFKWDCHKDINKVRWFVNW